MNAIESHIGVVLLSFGPGSKKLTVPPGAGMVEEGMVMVTLKVGAAPPTQVGLSELVSASRTAGCITDPAREICCAPVTLIASLVSDAYSLSVCG